MIPESSAGVLVVEDQPADQELMMYSLGKVGFAVTVANTGAEALEYAQSRAFRMALVDLRLPGMDGLTLIGILRQKYPDMLLAVVSAYIDENQSAAISEIGQGTLFIFRKPYDHENNLNIMAIVKALDRVEDRIAQMTAARRPKFGGTVLSLGLLLSGAGMVPGVPSDLGNWMKMVGFGLGALGAALLNVPLRK